MSILDKIIAAKQIEVSSRKDSISPAMLEKKPLFTRPCLSLTKALLVQNSSGIIAEFKRKSPSKGVFNAQAKTSNICKDYERAGAAGLSILTDLDFFGGSLADIEEVRALVNIPILRKDFIIDQYQILEAKAVGADIILLIAAALSIESCKVLSSFARSLGLEVLLEVHNEEELAYCNQDISLLGVNNRNLQTFETRVELSKELAALIPNEFVKVAESGLSQPKQVKELKEFGYSGFLIGENFMKESSPGDSCAAFIGELR